MAVLVANEELHIEMLVISPDSVETSRVWAESRECGNPVTMLGRWSGPLGVLDTIAHLASKGLVQAVKVLERWELEREAFTVVD